MVTWVNFIITLLTDNPLITLVALITLHVYTYVYIYLYGELVDLVVLHVNTLLEIRVLFT